MFVGQKKTILPYGKDTLHDIWHDCVVVRSFCCSPRKLPNLGNIALSSATFWSPCVTCSAIRHGAEKRARRRLSERFWISSMFDIFLSLRLKVVQYELPSDCVARSTILQPMAAQDHHSQQSHNNTCCLSAGLSVNCIIDESFRWSDIYYSVGKSHPCVVHIGSILGQYCCYVDPLGWCW